MVAQGWRTERLESFLDASLHERMLHIYLRRGQPEGTGFQFRGEMLLEESKDFLVRVAFIRPHIDSEGTLVGDNIVLRAGIDDGHRLLHWT